MRDQMNAYWIHYTFNMLMIIPILLSMMTVSEGSWANNLGGMLSRSCMYSFGISGIKSEFEANHGDRLWAIKCSKIGLFEGDDICMWTCEYVLLYIKISLFINLKQYKTCLSSVMSEW